MATSDGCDTFVEASGSTVFYDNICQPCENDGNILEAEGRCEDCDEYLCKPCFLAHTVPSITRHHVLIGNDQLDGAQDRKDQCTQKCSQHNDEIIKYYCPYHLFLGCSACMIINHKSCSGTIYIPEVSKDVLNSEEYSNYKANKSAIETRIQEITTDAIERIETFNTSHTSTVQKLMMFKKEMIDLFETAVNTLIEESEHIKEGELKKQESILDKSSVVEEELKTLTSAVESFKSLRQYCNMYMAIMKTKDGLKSCNNRLGEIDQRKDPNRKLCFFQNHSIVASMSSRGIGHIKDEITQVVHERNVNVKTQSDNNYCWIAGSLILSGNKLVITDRANDKLKMIDTRQDKVVEELSFSSHPWNVTETRPNEVAVTLFESKIAFVKTDGKLVNHRNIDVVGNCRGVAYRNNTLVVTYENPPKVEVMDMKGVVLRTFATDHKFELKLQAPLFVVDHPVNKSIYISDYKSGKVVCLTSDGTLESTYTHTTLDKPMGMEWDSFGAVYVCDWDKHTVHQITHDCKKKRILLTEKDVTQPYAISYCVLHRNEGYGHRESFQSHMIKQHFTLRHTFRLIQIEYSL